MIMQIRLQEIQACHGSTTSTSSGQANSPTGVSALKFIQTLLQEV
jgi:hypothetical protein